MLLGAYIYAVKICFLNAILLFVFKLRIGPKTAINIAINPLYLQASVFPGATTPFLRMPSWPNKNFTLPFPLHLQSALHSNNGTLLPRTK